VGDEDIGSSSEKLDEGLTNDFANFVGIVGSVLEETDDEGFEMKSGEGIVVGRDELNGASESVSSNLWVRRIDVREEFRNHEVERSLSSNFELFESFRDILT